MAGLFQVDTMNFHTGKLCPSSVAYELVYSDFLSVYFGRL